MRKLLGIQFERADLLAAVMLVGLVGASASPAQGAGDNTLFAVATQAGVLSRGDEAVAVNKLALGQYEVIFSRRVNNCAYSATIGKPKQSNTANAGFTTVVGRAGNTKGVFIETFDTSGSSRDRGFQLIVVCP